MKLSEREGFRQGTTAKPVGGEPGRQAKTALTLSAVRTGLAPFKVPREIE